MAQHRPLFAHLASALAPNGILVYETFALGNERFGKPSNPAFLLASGELLVDEGAIGTVEWRWSLNSELTPFVFYDAARGKIVREEALIEAFRTGEDIPEGSET